MRKLFILAALDEMLNAGMASGVSVGDYCVENYTNNTCYWCAANEEANAAQGAYCTPAYVGCYKGNEVRLSAWQEAVDSNARSYRCTANGFCRTDCAKEEGGYWGRLDGLGAETEGAEFFFDPSGCDCTEFHMNTGKVRCMAGWYGVPDRNVYTGCVRCPALTGADGTVIYGNSTAGENTELNDCWFGSGDGPFAGDNGEYVFVNTCNAS